MWPFAEVPLDGNMASWFGWAVVTLGGVITASLGYLIASLKKQEDGSKDLLKQLITNLEHGKSEADERVKESEGRLAHAWSEHEKVLAATMHRSDDIANTLSKIATSSDDRHKVMLEQFDGLKKEVRKKSGGTE